MPDNKSKEANWSYGTLNQPWEFVHEISKARDLSKHLPEWVHSTEIVPKDKRNNVVFSPKLGQYQREHLNLIPHSFDRSDPKNVIIKATGFNDKGKEVCDVEVHTNLDIKDRSCKCAILSRSNVSLEEKLRSMSSLVLEHSEN